MAYFTQIIYLKLFLDKRKKMPHCPWEYSETILLVSS